MEENYKMSAREKGERERERERERETEREMNVFLIIWEQSVLLTIQTYLLSPAALIPPCRSHWCFSSSSCGAPLSIFFFFSLLLLLLLLV